MPFLNGYRSDRGEAEVKIGEASFKCTNEGYGRFTKAQAEALLQSCQSLAKS